MSRTRKKRDNKKPFGSHVGVSQKADSNTLPPVFSFERMQDGNGYSVTCCETEDQAALAKKLFKLSKLSWREIMQAPRHGLGTEKISKSAIRKPIPPNVTDDVTFLALRFSGTKAMVGYRGERVFYVIWLDRDYSVYSHG